MCGIWTQPYTPYTFSPCFVCYPCDEQVEPVNIVGFDISGLDEPWDDDEVGIDKTDKDALPDQRRVGICPGHERALPINELVHLLDMKEEGE
jgi:hypothetical protein